MSPVLDSDHQSDGRIFLMRRAAVLAMLIAVGITLWAHAGLAQSGGDVQSLKKEIDALKEGQTAIQKDLQEIKNLLRARPVAAPPAPPPPPQEVVVSVDGAPFKGKKDAKVTLVDFTDYQ
jgi:protein-disulfide isomerase